MTTQHNAMEDQNFNGVAKKFVKNIYGTTKGKLRHQLLVEALDHSGVLDSAVQAIDIGGGSGIMSSELAKRGLPTTLVDPSDEIIMLAKSEHKEQKLISFENKSLYQIDNLSSYDLIICHAVLEWLSKPLEAVSFLLSNMRKGSVLSLSFFNRDANLFGNAVYGNFEYIEKGMKVKNQVRLNPQNPVYPKDVMECVSANNGSIEQITGIRCFHDYMKKPIDSEESYTALLNLERQYCRQAPYVWLGKYMHFIITKTAD